MIQFSVNLRHRWKIASQALIWDRKAFPRPWPSDAPLTSPAMSTTLRKAGTLLKYKIKFWLNNLRIHKYTCKFKVFNTQTIFYSRNGVKTHTLQDYGARRGNQSARLAQGLGYKGQQNL